MVDMTMLVALCRPKFISNNKNSLDLISIAKRLPS